MHQDPGELPGGDDELGDEINSVIAVTSKLGRRSLIRPKLAVELESYQKRNARVGSNQRWARGLLTVTHLSQVQTSTIASIVIIPVHVKDLLAFDGQQAGENALSEASAEDNDLFNGRSVQLETDATPSLTSYSSSMV